MAKSPSTSDLDAMKERLKAISGRSHVKRKEQGAAPDTSLKRYESKKQRKDSKAKGNRYENKIAKLFSRWSGEDVRRTPQSGGWSKAAFGVAGDLVCSNKRFPFHIECKKREGWFLEDLILGVRVKDSRSVRAWWKQTTETCPKRKVPMLVFAHNNVGDLAMLRADDYKKLVGNEWGMEFLPVFWHYTDDGDVVIVALHMLLAKLRPPKGCANYKKHKFKAKKLYKVEVDR